MRGWQQKRNRLNHDRLKNGLCLEVARLKNILRGEVEVDPKDAVPDLTQWRGLFDEIRALVSAFPIEMSPRCLFNEGPLSACDQETKDWLSVVIHDSWITSRRTRTLVLEAEDKLDDASESFFALLRRIGDQNEWATIHTRKELLFQTMTTYEKLMQLSATLSRFPDRILPLDKT